MCFGSNTGGSGTSSVEGVIWETFDDEQQLIDTATLADFKRALERQAG